MNIYVATSFQNIPEARAVMDLLVRAGHTITHDWTHEHVDTTWSKERQETYFQTCGRNDFEGVLRADAVVLVNHTLARDAMTEFGIALGLAKPVFVLYPDRRPSVFFHRAFLFTGLGDFLETLTKIDGEMCRARSALLREEL